MVTKTKFCVDCRHFIEDDLFQTCKASQIKNVNLVSGAASTWYPLCKENRKKTGRCKPEGLLFEPKEVVTVQHNPSFFATIRSWFTNKE